jgi:TolA-binding protein
VKQPETILKRTLSGISLAFIFATGLANAQTASPVQEMSFAPTNLIQATQQYQASSKELLTVQEKQLSEATAKLEQLRGLVADGLVARLELEESEQALVALRSRVEAAQRQIADADNVIAEIQAAQTSVAKPAKLVAQQSGTFNTTATILRYNGASPWSLGGLNEIRTFFSAKFGHSLPTSAIGQSATHNQLGYDHRNAVDVALNPDSAEGKTLINYLQSQGIPFLAFRAAIPGVATGPHIHIGSPSHRLS